MESNFTKIAILKTQTSTKCQIENLLKSEVSRKTNNEWSKYFGCGHSDQKGSLLYFIYKCQMSCPFIN